MNLLEPFSYQYMASAIGMSALVGGICAFLSVFLMLKGWSLIGDALSHAIVPGVAGAYMIGLPMAAGAFFAGGLSAFFVLFLREQTRLKEDTVIGLVFTAFFGLGLFMVSLNPVSIDVKTIMLGNILAIPPTDQLQILLISLIVGAVLTIKWRDIMVVFFDETHARAIGISVQGIKILFFTLLSMATVAALQTVGAFLVIAMVVTPGATAYLISDRFDRILMIAVAIGVLSSFFGAYLSYFMDAATGAVIVLLQTACFLLAFFFAPKHGLKRSRNKGVKAGMNET